MMLPVDKPAARKPATNACDTPTALFRCELIIAPHADSGKRSNGPVSSAAWAGDDPRPALLTRMDAVPNRLTTSATATTTERRTVAATAWVEIGAPVSISA